MMGAGQFRLLVFSRSFPPSVGGTSTVLSGLFSQFSPDALTVITGKSDVSEPEWPKSILDIRRFVVGSPYLLRRLGPKALEWYWIRRRIKIAKKMVREAAYTAILGVIPGPEYVVSAYLTHIVTGLPLYLYYLDTTMSYPGEAKWRRRILNQYEHQWIKVAREIFVLSEGLAEDLEKRLGVERFTILRHSLRPDAIVPQGGMGKQLRVPERVVFVGNVRKYTHVRPLNIVIEVLEDLAQSREIRLEIFTKQTRKALIVAGLKDSEIWTNSYYGNQRILVEERSACLLLVPLDDKSPLQSLLRTVLPTKTVEAMVTGVPILVIAPEDTYTAHYARASGFAYVVSDIRTEAIREAIGLLLNDMELRKYLVQAAWRTAIQNHDARRIAEIFRQKLQRHIP